MTDEEINRITFEQWGPVIDVPPAAHRAFARAIIAAYQAKLLAGVEMPEPVDLGFYMPMSDRSGVPIWNQQFAFTTDQLQQYAAAAAAQAREKALEDVGALVTVGATYEEVMLYLQSEIEKLKGGE